jgi:hypothetical protein
MCLTTQVLNRLSDFVIMGLILLQNSASVAGVFELPCKRIYKSDNKHQNR